MEKAKITIFCSYGSARWTLLKVIF